MSPEQKKALVRQWIHKVWDAGDFSAFEQFAAPGYAYAAPGTGPLGRQALEAAVLDLKRHFSDHRNTFEGQVVDGEIVVTRGITHLTDTATARAIEIPWMMWTRFAGDKITEDWEVYDKPASIQQMGQVPNSGAQTGTAGSAPSNSLSKELESAIRQSWADFAKHDKSAYAADVAEDETEVWTDGKGVHDKAAVLREMDNVNLKSHSLSDFKVTQLGPDAALVTYRAKVEGANGERTFNSDMDVTDVEVKRDGKWKELRYHESERTLDPPQFTSLAGTVWGQQSAQASNPGPEHQKLAIWVGDWRYEGQAKESPMGPAGKFSGNWVGRPILGGLFVEVRGHETSPLGDIDWMEIQGYDPVHKEYTWTGYGSDRGSSAGTYTLDGAKVSYAGTITAAGKQYRLKGTHIFAPDFTSYVDKQEISTDGKTWAAFVERKFTKVKAAPETGAKTQAQ